MIFKRYKRLYIRSLWRLMIDRLLPLAKEIFQSKNKNGFSGMLKVTIDILDT